MLKPLHDVTYLKMFLLFRHNLKALPEIDIKYYYKLRDNYTEP